MLATLAAAEEAVIDTNTQIPPVPFWAWIGLAAIIIVMLTIDLLAHRKAHIIEFKEAAVWSAVWVGLSLVFAGVLFFTLGNKAGLDFTTAWLLEKSLSVDNLFVFALIFGYFAVPRAYQHRVLFYGVLGALIFRGIFLAAGVAIVNQFVWVLFIFAIILLYSSFKLFKGDDDDDMDMDKNIGVRILRKFYPVTNEYHGTKFFIKEAGKRVATPLLAVVAAIEAADLIFAVDSVPAVLAVSDNTFIIYSSNAFAILGLRALYFMLEGLLKKFHHLGRGLAIILAFIGVKLILQALHKMVSPDIPEIPSWISLIVIVVVLTASIIWSLMDPQPEDDDGPDVDPRDNEPITDAEGHVVAPHFQASDQDLRAKDHGAAEAKNPLEKNPRENSTD